MDPLKHSSFHVRVNVDHKESMKAWADRLGISLTHLYLVLVGQVGSDDLNTLVYEEFSCKQLQRLGLPEDAIPILMSSPAAFKCFAFLLSCIAKKEFAEMSGDLDTAEMLARQIETTEGEILRAFGAAVRAYYPASVEGGHHVTDSL